MQRGLAESNSFSGYLGVLGFNQAYAMRRVPSSSGNHLTRDEVIEKAMNLGSLSLVARNSLEDVVG